MGTPSYFLMWGPLWGLIRGCVGGSLKGRTERRGTECGAGPPTPFAPGCGRCEGAAVHE